MKIKDGGWLLPSVVNPPRVCVQLWIPDDTNHKRAFWGALYALSEWWNWQRDDSKTARDVARVWLDVFFQAQEQNLEYDACEDVGEDKCFSFPPNAPFIEWFPNNPYTQPDLVGEGYNSPAWYLATPASNIAYGTSDGDVITSLDRFPPGSLPSIIPASGLPRFRVHVNGTGVVKLHLVNMFAGSIAQITVDDNILGARFIDLLRDAISAPPEVNDLIVIETYIDTPGDHYIDVIIVSMFNDQLPFLFHGGGLRKVELCGLNASDYMPEYNLSYDGCNLLLIKDFELQSSIPLDTVLSNCGYTDGASVELRIANGCIEWRQDDDSPTWQCLIELSELEGATGPQGVQGVPGPAGPQGAPGVCPDCDEPPAPDPIDPPVGVDPVCYAAASAEEVIKATYLEFDRITNTQTSPIGIAAALIAFVAAMILFPPAITVIVPIVSAWLLLNITADATLYTPAISEASRCILFCNASINAGVVTFDFAAVRQAAVDKGAADCWPTIVFILDVIGADGLNLAATTNAAPADVECDCPDCDDGVWCYEFNFASGEQGWVGGDISNPYASAVATYSGGTGWTTKDVSGPGSNGGTNARRHVSIKRSFTSATVTSVEVQYTYTAGTFNPVNGWTRIYMLDNTGQFAGTINTAVPASPFSWSGSRTMNMVEINISSSARLNSGISYSGACTISKVIMRGEGENPFGDDNCI